MKTEEFLGRVCDQIRCGKAHPLVREELAAHVEDQKHAFVQAGAEEWEAEERAVAEMGDPVIVGGQLDRTHRPKLAWNVAILSAVMLFAGGCLQWALGFWAEEGGLGSWLLGAALAATVLAAVYFADYTLIGRHGLFLYLALVIGGGVLIRGMDIQGVTISRIFTERESVSHMQYYVTLLAAPLFAGIVYRCRNRGYGGILVCLLFLIAAIYGACLAPSALAALVFGLTAVSLLTLGIWRGHFGEKRKRYMAFFWGTGFAACFTMVMGLSMSRMLYEYRIQRIIHTFLPALGDPVGSGWVTSVLRQLWSGASFFGGVGAPDQPLLEEMTGMLRQNYPLTYLAAQSGIWSTLALGGLLAAFLCLLAFLAAKQKNVLGYLTAWSVTFAFGYSGLFYILSNLGLIHLATGVLPFMSVSGGSLVVSAALIGVFLSVCKGNDYIRDRDIESGETRGRAEKWIDQHLLKYRVRITLERSDEL